MSNRNTRSTTLKPRDDRAKEIFYESVKFFDVVDDHFRPGILENFRTDHETLEHGTGGEAKRKGGLYG